MQSTISSLDGFIRQILFAKLIEQEITAEEQEKTRGAFGLSVAFSGIRCIIQYMILPFVLPVIGIAGQFADFATAGINIVAIITLVWTLRHFWRIDYKYKWAYLTLAVPAFVMLVAFMVQDINMLL